MKKMLTAALLLVGASALAGEAFELKGDAAKGKESFTMYCVACHGEKGDGNGPAGAALNPKPGNFTDAKRAAEIDDKYIYMMIKEGGAANGKSPLMVAWKAALDDQKIRDVAAYVRTFSPTPAKAAKPAKGKKAKK